MMLDILDFRYKETNVKILTDEPKLVDKATDYIIELRKSIENYAKKDSLFLTALETYKSKHKQPEIVKRMFDASKLTKIGPMASVAGIISEFTAKKLVKLGAKTAIVENGGDIYAITQQTVNIGLYTGRNKLADKLAFQLDKDNTPLSICSSSSKLGHSLSFGDCDLVTVFSKDAALADSVATLTCNNIKDEQDLKPVIQQSNNINGILGIIAIKNDKLGLVGYIPKLIQNKDKDLKEKVTKDFIYEL